MPQFYQPCTFTQLEDFQKQTGQRSQMVLAKRRNRRVVRILIGCQHPKPHVLSRRHPRDSLQQTRTVSHAGERTTAKQKRDQHQWGRLWVGVLAVSSVPDATW